MRKLLALSSLAIFAIFSSGCATETEQGAGEEVDDIDEGGQEASERTVSAYPEGPFGDSIGSIIRDYKFRGFARPQDGNFAGQMISMSDFYNPTGTEMHAADSVYGEKPKPLAIMVIIAAGWCGPCQQEAKNVLPGEYTEFAPKAEFITIMAEDAGYNEPSLTDIENWATKYKAQWPSVVDGQFKFFALAAEPAFPANILIDAKTMTIVDRVAGADPAIFTKMKNLIGE
ncbi:MAG: hypothetical protein HOV80_10160 [Polyangiaceae bacterium]|nr:hypothetical protein [Polyangiaceae bacterium]